MVRITHSSLEKLNIFAIEVDRMVENIKKATLAAIMTNLSKWDSSELERALLKICRDEAKGIHRGFSLVRILKLALYPDRFWASNLNEGAGPNCV